MYEARQYKTPTSHILPPLKRKFEQQLINGKKHIGTLMNRNFTNATSLQKSIQKKDPEYLDMPTDVILSHGSNSQNFYNRETDELKNPQVPDGPAWFGVDDDFISLLTTIRHSNLKNIGTSESIVFPIYRYTKKNDINIKIAKWETWPESLEYLLYNQESDLYKNIAGSDERNSDVVEPKLPAYSGAAYDLSDANYAALKTKKLHWQTKEAANGIFNLIPDIHAYYLKHDPIIPSSPEYVLKDEAMNNLEVPTKKNVTLTKIDSSRYNIEYNGKTVYWSAKVKDHLSQDLDDRDKIESNTKLQTPFTPAES